jgi:hypothetical protein
VTRLRALAMSIGIVAAALALANAPPAQALPSNCQSQPWGFLGSQTRQICDYPMGANGVWMRERIIGRAAYIAKPSSHCSFSSYSSSCTYDPGGYVPEYQSANETYPVTVDTVLPDEPGYMGG